MSEYCSDVQLHLLPGHEMPSMSLLDQKEDVSGEPHKLLALNWPKLDVMSM